MGRHSGWRRFLLPGRIRGLLAKANDWNLVADDLLEIYEYQVGKQVPTLVPSATVSNLLRWVWNSSFSVMSGDTAFCERNSDFSSH